MISCRSFVLVCCGSCLGPLYHLGHCMWTGCRLWPFGERLVDYVTVASVFAWFCLKRTGQVVASFASVYWVCFAGGCRLLQNVQGPCCAVLLWGFWYRRSLAFLAAPT